MTTRLLACAFALLALPAHAGDFSDAARATTSGDFLTLSVGARASAMGEAYSAVADDADALYWNPADLVSIPHRSATFMHAPYLGTSYFDYLAFGQNLGSKGAFGAGLQYFSAGDISQTDATGADAGKFSPYDLALSAGYGYRLHDLTRIPALEGYSLGLSLKYIQSKILATANSMAVDFGALSPAYLDGRLRLAFTGTNLGGSLKYESISAPLPFALRLGSSYRLNPAWIASMDVAFPKNDNPYVALGTEYWLWKGGTWSFAGRLGFNSQTIGSLDGFTGLSTGFGVGCSGLKVDYAFVPLGGLGQAHRISITYNF